MTDISLWIMLAGLQAAPRMRSYRAQSWRCSPRNGPHDHTTGNGPWRNADPVTLILGALRARFASLEEESRLACMTEMLACSCRSGETINALLARYETVRQRAAVEGQFVMNIESCALQVLRACGIQSQHFFMLLQPFRGGFHRQTGSFKTCARSFDIMVSYPKVRRAT
jgi:hypothetical protein